MDLAGAMSQMVILLLVASAGFLAAKLGYLDEYTNKKLTQLLMNITLPCLIVSSVYGLDAAQAGSLVPWSFGLSAAQYFLLLGTGALCALILRVPKKDRVTYKFMASATNNGFIGLPVVAAVLGTGTVIVSSIFVMVLAFFVYTVGFGMLARSAGTSSKIPWKSIFNPSMIASLIAIAFFFGGVKLPSVLQGTLEFLGGITSPIAMLVVGVIMAGISFKSIVGEVKLYPFILIRQLIVPVLLLLLFTFLGFEPTVVGVFTLMFAMPVGSMTPTFIEQFDGNVQLAAKGTVLSTIASFIVIPLLVAVMLFI